MRTPYFSFDMDRITAAWRGVTDSFADSGLAPLVAYAVKVNPDHMVMRHLARLGAGAEVVSLRELRAALDVGIPGERIVVNGAYKPAEYLAEAIAAGARINVETPRQLEAVATIARGQARVPSIGVRLAARTKQPSRFGIPQAHVVPVLDRCAELMLKVHGVHVHHAPGVDGADQEQWQLRAEAIEWFGDLRHSAVDLRWIDWGGGLQAPSALAPAVKDFQSAASVAADVMAGWASSGGGRVAHIIEPGRFLVEHAGTLHLTCVDLVPQPDGPLVVMLDAGVGLLSAHDCWHGQIVPAAEMTSKIAPDRREPVECLVTGPSAMEEDVIMRGWLERVPAVGEQVNLTRVGAYHHAGANTFFHDPPSVRPLGLTGMDTFDVGI